MDARAESGISESRDGAIRAELNRLLDSAPFRNSKRCSEFLKYIVEQTLGGAVGTLKERSIGVELFQLPPDFDTGQHAIVRVTANEVRKRLAQHYLADGNSSHQVRIDLPPGSYSADFKWEQPASEVQIRERPNRVSRRTITLAAAALLVLGAFLVWWWYGAKPASSQAKSASVPGLASTASLQDGDLRVAAGSTNSYTDRNGRVWGQDRFFSGGIAIVRPAERILRTLDPDIYRHLRSGDFRYDIPLRPGVYELHLHFAETGLTDSISVESSGEGQRLFRVSINGNTALEAFDVVADAAGANIASERVIRNVSPGGDGFLHLSFSPMKGSAMVSGIEVLPVAPGQVRPLRVRAGWPTSWRDAAGEQWLAESYFLGGNALVRPNNPVLDSTKPDAALYASERWGHFSYSLPVAGGRYRVTLRFCEAYFGGHNAGGGGVGSRMFDVYCNGVALLRDFDIFKQAGGEGRPIDRTFSGIRPTAQGKIVLTFVPVKEMACVNGIEVVEDAR